MSTDEPSRIITDHEELIIWRNEARMLRAERDTLKAELVILLTASRELLVTLEGTDRLEDMIGYANRLRHAIRTIESRL